MELAAQVEGMFDQQSLGYFLSGLWKEIRVRTHSYDTFDLVFTMTLTLEIEMETKYL